MWKNKETEGVNVLTEVRTPKEFMTTSITRKQEVRRLLLKSMMDPYLV